MDAQKPKLSAHTQVSIQHYNPPNVHKSPYPVEDFSNSFVDSVIVIMETCRVVSKLQGTVQKPLDNAGHETLHHFKSTAPNTLSTNIRSTSRRHFQLNQTNNTRRLKTEKGTMFTAQKKRQKKAYGKSPSSSGSQRSVMSVDPIDVFWWSPAILL